MVARGSVYTKSKLTKYFVLAETAAVMDTDTFLPVFHYQHSWDSYDKRERMCVRHDA